MKVRQGFVSNSSSSSFIIRKNEKAEDVFIVAEKILNHYDDECIEEILKYKDCIYLDEHIKEYKEIFDNLVTLRTKKDDDAIAFQAGYSPTYIKDIGDFFLVNTTAHNKWYVDMDMDLVEFQDIPDLVKTKKIKEAFITPTFGINEFDHILAYIYNYRCLETGIYGKPTKEICNSCNNEFWEIDGEVKCPKCNTKQNNNVSSRVLKNETNLIHLPTGFDTDKFVNEMSNVEINLIFRDDTIFSNLCDEHKFETCNGFPNSCFSCPKYNKKDLLKNALNELKTDTYIVEDSHISYVTHVLLYAFFEEYCDFCMYVNDTNEKYGSIELFDIKKFNELEKKYEN